MLAPMRRWWYRRQVDGGPMADFLSSAPPSGSEDARKLEWVALDFETTGLDPASDSIVSAGSVRVENGRIRCSTARHLYVRIDRSVDQSATIHRIRDSDLDGARSEREMLEVVLGELTGRVLLAHHAPVELGFLDAACRRHFGVPFVAPAVCTLDLARRRRNRGDREPREGELRLHALRTDYGLPRYPAHDALTDALATAELFLAMLPEWSGSDALPLRTILH